MAGDTPDTCSISNKKYEINKKNYSKNIQIFYDKPYIIFFKAVNVQGGAPSPLHILLLYLAIIKKNKKIKKIDI